MKKPEIVMVKISDLVPWPGNPRRHEEADVAVVSKLIERFGWTNPILAQRGTNRIIAGHGRLQAAKKRGMVEVPVIYLEMNDQDATAYTIADNRSAELSEWDPIKLRESFTEIDDGAFDMTLTGFSKDEIKVFFGDTGDDQSDDEPEPAKKPAKCPKCGAKLVCPKCR